MREKDISPTEFWDEMAPYYDEYIARTRYEFSSLRTRQNSSTNSSGSLPDLRHGLWDGKDDQATQRAWIQVRGNRHLEEDAPDSEKVRRRELRPRRHSASTIPGFDIRRGIFPSRRDIAPRTFDEKLLAFGEISRILKPGGLLFIDVRNPYRRDTGETFVVEWPAGQKKIKTMGYALWPKDARGILRKSRFKLERLLGGYDLKEKYTKESRRLIIIASKGGGSK
jgi:SAM-dependent methyltransferase